MSEDTKKKSPSSIAVIMDGNRRWAVAHGREPYEGHIAGFDKLKEFLEWVSETEIRYVTVFAFSSENWKRSRKEVGHLKELLLKAVSEDDEMFIDKGIKVRFVGDLSTFPKQLQMKLKRTEARTAACARFHLTVALSYGGRWDIVEAARRWCADGAPGSESEFSEYLATADTPDPDLVIRTGGEKRISNFLLWQMAYSELFFVDSFWPDLKKSEFMDILDRFSERTRRIGK